jgi:hypothetical protein
VELDLGGRGVTAAVGLPLRGEAVGRTPDEANIENKMAVARIAVLLRFISDASPH